MKEDNLLPVILCGGSGTRLWPESRESFPKQFIDLNSDNEESLLQQTLLRLKEIKNLNPPILICNEQHRFIVAEQSRAIGINPNSIILEPESRNTAAAIALAALEALRTEKDPILLILPSDHLIKNNLNFLRSLNSAIEIANQNKIVTFGVVPNSPEIGFGYIKSYSPLNSDTLDGSEIDEFIEKPNIELAKKFLKDKRFSWNSGMFLFKSSVIISEMKKFAPEVVQTCSDALSKIRNDFDFKRFDGEIFRNCPSISIDVAVMEKTNIGFVVPLDANWSDIGNWKSLWEYEQKNESGNLIRGNVLLEDVENSFIKSDNRLVIGIGVKNLIAIDTDDALLISDMEHSQKIKEIINNLKKKGIKEASEHKKGFRPWGNYISIANGKRWQVKLINVNPGASLSLQKHHHRAEHWVVVRGTAQVKVENSEKILFENQSTFIPIGAIHQLSNPGKLMLSIIEIQSGDYLGEDDIIRLKDNYGRLN